MNERAKKALTEMSCDDLIQIIAQLREQLSKQELELYKLNKEIERLNNELIINESKKL